MHAWIGAIGIGEIVVVEVDRGNIIVGDHVVGHRNVVHHGGGQSSGKLDRDSVFTTDVRVHHGVEDLDLTHHRVVVRSIPVDCRSAA